MRRAVLILGIARSGTSAIAGALASAGLPFGDGLKPADWQNPKGNREDLALSQLNQELLALFGATWSSVRPLPLGWLDQPAVQAIAERMQEDIEARFGAFPAFGLKDPRLVPLYPLYAQVLARAGVATTLVTTERDKREVLTSIRKSGYYHGLYLPFSGHRLYRHYMAMIAALRTNPGSLHLRYEDLISTPRASLAGLIEGLALEQTGIALDPDRGAAFIDPALWRNRHSAQKQPSIS